MVINNLAILVKPFDIGHFELTCSHGQKTMIDDIHFLRGAVQPGHLYFDDLVRVGTATCSGENAMASQLDSAMTISSSTLYRRGLPKSIRIVIVCPDR